MCDCGVHLREYLELAFWFCVLGLQYLAGSSYDVSVGLGIYEKGVALDVGFLSTASC